jgi:hypothetical protein
MGTGVGSTEESWAVAEFAEAELGDARRTQRLIRMATVFARQLMAGLPEACGSPAALKAAYRLFDNEAIAPADILAGHVSATYERAVGAPIVLAVQDTTEVDWTASGHDGVGADRESDASGLDGA